MGNNLEDRCMVSQTWTSLNFNRFRINWPAIVTKSPPFTRSVPILRSLHWLPVIFKILFKINLLTYKPTHEKQPVYLHSTLAASLPSHSLRSNKGISLLVPRVKTNSGARAFRSCAPFSLEQPATVCPFNRFTCCLQETSEDTSVSPSLSHIVISMPDDPLMLSINQSIKFL